MSTIDDFSVLRNEGLQKRLQELMQKRALSKTEFLLSTVDEFSTEQIEQIENRMQIGALSETGFLNTGERLKDVIKKDEQTLQKLGITHKQIADRLESIIGKAERLEQLAERGELEVGQILVVENLYKVSTLQFMGSQECPFIDLNETNCPYKTSRDYFIKKIGDGTYVAFSGLIIHLVRDHHFFEGSVKYRLDPQQVIKTLGIQTEYDYSPSYATEKVWKREKGTIQSYDELEGGDKLACQTAINSADEVIQLSDNTFIYIQNEICLTVSDIDYLLPKEVIVSEGWWVNKIINKGVWVYKLKINTYVAI